MTKTQRQEAFLQAFRETGTLKGAAEATGIQVANHYNWAKTDPSYGPRAIEIIDFLNNKEK